MQSDRRLDPSADVVRTGDREASLEGLLGHAALLRAESDDPDRMDLIIAGIEGSGGAAGVSR